MPNDNRDNENRQQMAQDVFAPSATEELARRLGFTVVVSDAEDDGYTSRPTHLRIYKDEYEGNLWMIDGADDSGNYTEGLFGYETYAEALAHMETFVEDLTGMGVEWDWQHGRRPSCVRWRDTLKKYGEAN